MAAHPHPHPHLRVGPPGCTTTNRGGHETWGRAEGQHGRASRAPAALVVRLLLRRLLLLVL